NAGIAAPSDAAFTRLFAMIDAESAPAVASSPQRNQARASTPAPVNAWLARLQAALTPKMAGFAIAGLAAIVVVQAGFLARLANLAAPAPYGYVTAAAPDVSAAPHLLVRFAPAVTVADATVWLAA